MLQDLRLVWRVWAKRPGYSATIVLTIAIGIAANATVFSIVNGLLFAPLPYKDAGRLVSITQSDIDTGLENQPVSPATFVEWRDRNRSFVDLAALTGIMPTVTIGDQPERLLASSVTPNYFSVLGVRPRLGRSFDAEEGQPGTDNVVILSDGFWRRQFGADPNVIGTTLSVNGSAYSIIGVMPRGFVNARLDYKPSEMWFPRQIRGGSQRRSDGYLTVVGRLTPGTSIDQTGDQPGDQTGTPGGEQIRAELDGLQTALEQRLPGKRRNLQTRITSLRDVFVGDVRPALRMLWGAVGLLLLIVCANVSSLLLARSVDRQKEIAIRIALGASRRRIIRHLLSESISLALIGGGVGILLSYWALARVVALVPRSIPRLQEIGIDGRVLGFTLALSVAAGVICGLLPAWRLATQGLSEALKEGGHQVADSMSGKYWRNLLAGAEIALSLMLVIGAGLLVKSFIGLRRIDPGFNPDRVVTAMLALPPARYHDNPQLASFCRDFVERVESIPGVRAAAAVSEPPLAGGKMLTRVEIPGRPRTTPASSQDESSPDGNANSVDYHSATPEYFAAIGAPILSGRSFDERDGPSAQRVVVINRAMARQFWPERDPVGERIVFPDLDTSEYEVVGVARNIRTESLTSAPCPQAYFPNLQRPSRFLVLVARTESDPLLIVPAVKAALHDMDKEQPLWNILTLDQALAEQMAGPRFSAVVMLTFAVVAAGLGALGIYGVISYAVRQRNREIGLRMALGASPRRILRSILNQGLRLTLVAAGFGLIGAYVLTRFMSTLLFGVSATDPFVFAAGFLVAILISTLAVSLPAWRASRTDPMVALKYE